MSGDGSKTSAKALVYEYVDGAPVGTEISPQDVKAAICARTAGMIRPMDSTVTRYLRYRRRLFGDVALKSRPKSLYLKTAPTIPD